MELGHTFDLIYLDLEMESMNGLEVSKKIRNELQDHKIDIVYISARDHYDRQLFDVQPLHFILKPIAPSKVIANLRLAITRADLLGGMFAYKKGIELHKIPIKDIVYFESFGREIKIVTIKRSDLFYGVMRKIFQKVKGHQFIKIHRSYIVNYNHISTFRYVEVIMSNGVILPIAQSRRKEIKDIQLGIEKEE